MAVWPKGLVTAASVVVSVAACGSAPANLAARQGDRIAVVASTDVWASVAAAVGADLITVKPIVAGQAGDPHSYQVNAKDAAELRAAELVVFNGGGYDDFVEESLGEGGPQRIKAVDLQPKPRTHEEENEHVWYDLPTVSMVADELAKRFGELRPSARTTFDANADAFNAKLDGLQAEVDELAHAGTAVAATEPVAHYLL